MNDGLKEQHRQAIIDIIAANERAERLVLFGSRAMGTYAPTSDVDLVLYGSSLTLDDQARLLEQLEDFSMPQRVDLLLCSEIKNQALLEHIREHGVVWWERLRRVGRRT